MIVSHSHNFVFLHVPKTGGKSVAQTLDDISIRTRGPHTSVASAREAIGAKKFKRYFKFTFVRNPWDRMVSMYEYNRHKGTFTATFNAFVMARARMKRRFTQIAWVTENAKLAVDFVGGYERFQADFNIVCKRIGIKPRVLKQIGRSKRGPYQEYYTDRTKHIVGELFKGDIEFFGYTYEE